MDQYRRTWCCRGGGRIVREHATASRRRSSIVKITVSGEDGYYVRWSRYGRLNVAALGCHAVPICAGFVSCSRADDDALAGNLDGVSTRSVRLGQRGWYVADKRGEQPGEPF